MKKVRFLFTVLLGVIFALGLASFVACAPSEPIDETTTATLTLRVGAGGGTLAHSEYEVEVGKDLSEFLKDISLTPEQGLTFAGWYKESAALGAGETMPQSGLTLTAKFYATYTLEIYRESAEGGYGEPERTTGQAFYQEAFTYKADADAHYDLDESAENKFSSEQLGKDEVFKVYYKRETYTLYYNANLPEGVEAGGSVLPGSCRYGQEIALAGCDYEVPELYRFAGWSTAEDGDAEYQPGDALSLEENVTLFAVWDVGYYDRFGGGDLIFFPRTKENVAVLLRAGEEHLGTRNGENFSFSNEDGERLKGKAGVDGTFVYYREALLDVTYRHADAYNDSIHEDGATLTFDGFGGATYREGDTVLTGTIVYDPDSMYYTFTDGQIMFDFMVTQLVTENETIDVYLRPGAETGSYLGLGFAFKDGIMETLQGNTLFLDGMGVAAMFDSEALMDGQVVMIMVGTYKPLGVSEVELELYDSEYDIHSYRAKLIEFNGGSAWLTYFEDFDKTYTAEDGAQLTLNGYGGTYDSAVYTSASGAKEEGLYVIDFSPLGYILRFIRESGEVTSFRLSYEGTEFSRLGDGSYKEYLRYFGDSAFLPVNSPVLVFGDNNSAILYTEDGDEIAGTVSPVAGTDRFLFDSETTKFEYELGGGYFSVMGQIYYFNYYKMYLRMEDADVDLTQKNGTGKFYGTYDASTGQGDAVYIDPDGDSHVGTYTVSNGADMMLDFDLVEFADIFTGVHYFFRFVGTEGSYTQFVLLGSETGVYYLYENGYPSDSAMLILIHNIKDDGTPELKVTYMDMETFDMGMGSYTYDDGAGTVTYTDMFTEESVSFDFMLIEAGEEIYFARHTELWNGEKTFTNDGHRLTLDGFGFGSYDDVYEGQYIIVGNFAEDGKEYVYRVYFFGSDITAAFEGYFDVDLKADTYTACGYEAGQYNANDDSGDILWLDGYGKVIRYNIHDHVDTELTPLEEGAYAFVDEAEEILRVTFESGSYYIKIWASYDGEEYVNYYTVAFDGAGTYVSDRWELLSLSAYGEAIFTDVYGLTYEGTYAKLSAHSIRFTSESLNEDQIFVLGENGKFTHPTQGFVIDGDTLVKYLGDMESPQAITIPEGVKKIAPLAFSVQEYGSRYRGVNVGSIDFNEVEEIGANAFNGCAALTSVVGEKVTKIGASAFYACIELSSITFNALTEIGEMAFRYCGSLERVTLPAVKTIYAAAFSGCEALVSIELPAVEMLYEGVFFDCFALESVVLGATLKQIGTPDESVAGVFGRSYGFEQSLLKVELKGKEIPVVGHNLFEDVTYYTVIVPDLATVKAFYLNESWENYNGHVGAASEYDGTYYRYSYGINAFVLDGLLYELNYGYNLLGAYEVRDDALYVLSFDAYEANKYTERQLFTFKNGVIVYDPYDYGDEQRAYKYFKSGEKLTLTVEYTEADTIEFTPTAGDLYRAGTVYALRGTWTNDGVKKDVEIRFELSQDFDTNIYMVSEGYRYSMSIYTNSFTDIVVSLGDRTFDPIVTYYQNDNTSILAISQNDEEGTQFTASFVLADIVDENGVPFSAVQVAVEKQSDGKTYKALQPQIFAGYSYSVTFVVNGDSFTYTAEREKRLEILSADGRAKAVIYQNTAGEVTNVMLYVDAYGYDEWTDIVAQTENLVFTQDGNVYRWLVYEYNYAGDYVLTLSGSGDSLTAVLTNGTAIKNYLDGVYVIAFYSGSEMTALYMRGSDEVYGKVEDSAIKEQNGYLEVTFKGDVYYIAIDAEAGSVNIVFADRIYKDYEGVNSVRVVRNPEGMVTAMTLMVDGKSYTTFTEYKTEYSSYYIFTDGTNYYHVELYTSNCQISKLSEKTYTNAETKFTVTMLVNNYGSLVQVISAKLNEKDAKVTFENKYISGEDYFYLTATVDDVTKNYLASASSDMIEELKEVIVEDSSYRVTILATESGVIFEAIKFAIKEGADFAEQTIGWCNTTSSESDDRNYEIGVGNASYYFKISKANGAWTLSFITKDSY